MKPARLFKKLGAAVAVGLLTLGLIAGTATGAGAEDTSGEINSPGTSGEINDTNGGTSGEISSLGGTSGEINAAEITYVAFSAPTSGEIN